MRIRGNLVRQGPFASTALVCAAALTVMLAVSGSASSQPLPTGSPGVSIIAQNGFGDRNNSMAWTMGWFKGKLYVGTGRDESCVENQTIQFYYPAARHYTTNPSPDVHCPANPYNMSLQAEIWRYTPARSSRATVLTTGGRPVTVSTSTPGRWKMVYRAPLIRNPLAKKMWVARDLAYRGMVVWRNPQGGQALFAAGVSPDEYLPPLLTSHPPVILRSFDGVNWQALHLPSVMVQFPNGTARPMGFRTLMVWKGHLLVTATPDITGDGALYEVTRPWSNHPGLRQVSGPHYDIFEFQTFDGDLYIGTGNKQVGYAVYRASSYNPNGYFNFRQVVGQGAGRGNQVTSVVSMHVYRNQLYVGSSGWYNQGSIPVSEMIRISSSGRWQVVVGNPRTLPDGQTLYPVSGIYDGFFSPFAAHFWRMQDQGGGLFVATNDWAYVLQEYKKYAWLQETVLAGVLGFNMWATCDGNDWFAVTRNGFTNNEYNFGGRNLVAGGPAGKDLYIGTANQAEGTTIFDDQADACGSNIKATRQAASRPGALMTNNLRHGTLLSWERSAQATSYQIERAPFTSVTMGLQAPATVPDGWEFDDATPTITDPGAPNSVTVNLSIPGGFTPVGTTTSPSFVDHSSGHYIYEVVAKTAAGTTSVPSNIEVTPFQGPPATFKELQTALLVPGVTGMKATPVVTNATSSLERLLIDAEAASARGDYALARRDVARLASAARGNDALAAVAARVQRRLQYASVAGAP